MTFHEDILTVRQKKALRRLGPFASENGFYLGGGTAVAIQLGHRRSKDFDWFAPRSMPEPLRLAEVLRKNGIPFTTAQVERGTLYGTAHQTPLSFFEYSYPLLKPTILWRGYECPLATLADLACMKLAAVAQRGSKKDFVDLYALGRETFSLADMLSLYQRKYEIRDIGHVLYALSFFDEADRERLPVMRWRVDWSTMRKTIQGWVKSCAG